MRSSSPARLSMLTGHGRQERLGLFLRSQSDALKIVVLLPIVLLFLPLLFDLLVGGLSASDIFVDRYLLTFVTLVCKLAKSKLAQKWGQGATWLNHFVLLVI